MSALMAGPGGWFLTPEGAVIHRVEGTAVVADVDAHGDGGEQ